MAIPLSGKQAQKRRKKPQENEFYMGEWWASCQKAAKYEVEET